MSTSVIDIQRHVFLQAIASSGVDAEDKWRLLVCDRDSRKLLDNVTKKDDVLSLNIIDIDQIEDKRDTQPDTKAIYLLTPTPHIVECLKADLSRKRYRSAYLLWTSPLRRDLEQSLNNSESRRNRIRSSRALGLDFFPRESNLISFQDPHSFQILFNPACDPLIRQHLDGLTQKIVSLCVALGEYPLVRYYQPRSPKHHAAELCGHLASFVQLGLDEYARITADFPPQSPRPRAILLITDRTMDLMAPLVHELTYQAMAMDLLPVEEEDDKIMYRNTIRRGLPDEQVKENYLDEKDKIWVEKRHLHMKDLLITLSEDFRKFQARNPQFAETDGQNISVNTIKDMLAGLPEFQEGKEAFSLHIDMAERCAKLFQEQKLLDVVSVEQSLATGKDEENDIPRNLADQLVRLLHDHPVVPPDSRLRLLIMYIIFRGGILEGDIWKLRAHGELTEKVYQSIIYNLQILGATMLKGLREPSIPYQPFYKAKEIITKPGEEISLSRFEPILHYALEEICHGTVDGRKFPATKPHLENQFPQANAAQTSLRSASKPTWASTRPPTNKPRQRVIVFMAGGATYSEARACYHLSQQMGKEIFLSTTDMLTPKKFLHEASKLNQSRTTLGLSVDQRAPELPAWMNEPPPESMRPQQPAAQQRPSGSRLPTDAMQNMSLGPPKPQNGSSRPGSSQTPTPPTTAGSFSPQLDHSSGKLKKEKKEKKHHLGLFRKH